MKHVDTSETIDCVEWCFGYGGNHLGLKRVIPSLRCIAASEIEAYACANMVAKMEEGFMDAFPIWSDCKTFPCESFHGIVDLFIASYPCQPFSSAGQRKGADDPRHLWPFVRRAVEVIRPRACFFENVEGHIGIGLREVLTELALLGYRVENSRGEPTWGVFSAAEIGAPHNRKRVFIYAEQVGVDLVNAVREQNRRHDAERFSSCLVRASAVRFGDGQAIADDVRYIHRESEIVATEGRLDAQCVTSAGGADELAYAKSSRDGTISAGRRTEGKRASEPDGASEELGDATNFRRDSLCEDAGKETGGSGERLNGGMRESSRAGSLPRDDAHEKLDDTKKLRYEQPWSARPWRAGLADASPDGIGVGLADSDSARHEGSELKTALRGRITHEAISECCGAWHWPDFVSRPNEKQKDFEPARVIEVERGLGGGVDGRSANVDRLRLLGNGVYPAAAAKAFLTLIERALI